jgi:hypothetical protein
MRLSEEPLLAYSARTTFLSAVLAVFAILTGVARIVAVAGCKGSIGHDAEEERQTKDCEPKGFAHREPPGNCRKFSAFRP